jgi:hypothetical protein
MNGILNPKFYEEEKMRIDHLPNKSPKLQRETICFGNKNSISKDKWRR